MMLYRCIGSSYPYIKHKDPISNNNSRWSKYEIYNMKKKECKHTRKAMGIKLSLLRLHSWQQSKCEQKIANTHCNKCKHPPSHSNLLVVLKSSFDIDISGQLNR